MRNRTVKSTRKALLFALPLAISLALGALVVEAGAQGRIIGKVTDAAGKPLEAVKVTVTTSSILKFKVTVMTDKDGKWGTILNDSTFSYRYRFEKEGYGAAEQEKKVPVGSTETLDIQLLDLKQVAAQAAPKEVIDPFTVAYNAAIDLFRVDDLPGATAKVEEALTAGPDKPIGFDLAAKIAFKAKNWDKVIEYGEKSLALDADNSGLYGPLAEAYRNKGNNAKSAEYQKKFASANPEQPEVVYNQAVAAYNEGNFKAAEPLLKKVVENKPDFANAHFLLGMSSMNLNKIAEMKKHLNEYLRLDPKGKEASAAKEMLDAFK